MTWCRTCCEHDCGIAHGTMRDAAIATTRAALDRAQVVEEVEPLQLCDWCLNVCAPGMACVSDEPGHPNLDPGRRCHPEAVEDA